MLCRLCEMDVRVLGCLPTDAVPALAMVNDAMVTNRVHCALWSADFVPLGGN